MDDSEIARSFGDERTSPVRFPPGETLLATASLRPDTFERVDGILASGGCPEGRLELETAESRLTCLIHRAKPYLAGLLERDVYSQVPLFDFALRARQLSGAACTLVRSDTPLVMMAAVHFCKRPDLQASTRLVDPAHVLRVLEEERHDAALSFERSGTRTLLFLREGRPARLYFGRPGADPGEGDLEERLLAFAFAPSAPPARLDVFTNLKLPSDPDAGTDLERLSAAAKPPPPAFVYVHLQEGPEVRRRPFGPPEMIVGRDPAVDLFIDNLAVSRRHARLAWERGAFVVEDLGSANGTAVNGEPVERAALAPGDRIQIGKFVVTLREAASMPQVPETMFIPTVPSRPPGFLLADGVSVPLERDLLIGSGEGVDVRAEGWFVRGVHCRIGCEEPGRYPLVCFGRSSVTVNGRRERRATLGFGDVLRVGRTELRIAARSGSSG